MEYLPKLIRSCDPDSRTKSTAITNECLAAESQEVLLKDLEESGGFYSLIIDETTDVSTKKSLAIVIRFYHGVVQDRFLGLVEVKSANAEALFNAIQNLLRKYQLPLENMLGFAADNASTMMGRLSGIQARLRNNNEHITILGCVCHSLHLCSSAAALKLPKSVEEFVRSLYNHFSNSSKRIQEFEDFQQFVNMKPYKMLKPAQTRWLSLQVVFLKSPFTLF
ncbi:hypothetical protein JTB14_023863 [Gonioctena quinquepunctata]|nr:hypothetical protein JTB14_023863 [Gonioctena quinquepunctata]